MVLAKVIRVPVDPRAREVRYSPVRYVSNKQLYYTVKSLLSISVLRQLILSSKLLPLGLFCEVQNPSRTPNGLVGFTVGWKTPQSLS